MSASSLPARDRKAVPIPAVWLTAGGAVPFIVCAVIAVGASDAVSGLAREAGLVYGAVILSFLGGIHWGLALATGITGWYRLSASVVPPLVAWGAFFLPGSFDALAAAFAFLAMAVYDHIVSRRGWAPHWYPRLRWPVTAAVAVSLLVIAAWSGTSV